MEKIDETGKVLIKVKGIKSYKRLDQYSVVYIDLGNGVLHEKSGSRPCVILSNNNINNKSTNVVIAPLTKYDNKQCKGIIAGESQVFISNKHYPEMKFASIVQLEDIRSVSKMRITEYLFDLQGKEIKQIKESERFLLGL